MFYRKRSSCVLACSIVVVAAAQSSSSGNALASVLSGNPSLSSFAAMIESVSNVITQLQNQPNITVFVPSNDALSSLSQHPDLQAQLSNPSYLQAVLQYHVIDETISTSQFTTTPNFAHTLLNSSSYANVTGGQVLELQREGQDCVVTSGLRQAAKVVQSDIQLANGLLHVIDGLLQVPGSVTDTALVANLTSFAGGLNIANLATPLDIRSDVTVFAPNNAAFQNIASIAQQFSISQLHEVLAYHVVPGSQGYSSLLSNTTNVPTLAGDDKMLNVTVVDGAVFVNAARVILADVLLSDGVLHVIDAVLNPNATAEQPNPAATTAPILFSSASRSSLGQQLLFTSGQPTPTASYSAFSSTTDRVVAGYSALPTRASQPLPSASTSTTSTAGAALPLPRATGLAQAAFVGGLLGIIVLG